MIPSDTNSISWDHPTIVGDRILSLESPRIIDTKVTIEPHFALKSGIKGSQKFLGVRAMDVDCMLFKTPKPSCARVLCSCYTQNIEVIYINS
jgi:hypothetical protein